MDIDINKFQELHEKKLTREEIADYFGVSLSTIKKFIAENNLQIQKTFNIDQFNNLYDEGKEDSEIAEILNVPKWTIINYRRKNKILSQKSRLRAINKEKFKELYQQGLNDSEISRILHVNNVTIRNWRTELNLDSNFKYSVKFDTNKFQKLYNEGLNDIEISKLLGSSSSAICEYRKKLGLSNNICNKDIPTYKQEQIIIGSVLGDMCIKLPKHSKHASGDFAHSLKQENYCKYKAKMLHNFVSSSKYRSQYDKRTKKTYYCYYVVLKASEYLTTLYYKFYPNGKKCIPKELLYKLDGLGIAIWFMDDGCKDGSSYSIATNCFSVEDLEIVKKFFKTKFDIDVTINKDRTIYIRANSRKKFTDLILPYIHSDCLYKIYDDLKTPLNRETPGMDNPVLNPQETEENAERLEVMPNE